MITRKFFISVFALLLMAKVLPVAHSYAATAGEINAGIDATLNELKGQVIGASDTLAKAKGLLVFPSTWKAGITLGGQYGEGGLQVGSKVTDYYSIAGLSLGFQLGVQKQRVVLAFMSDEALSRFQQGDGWEFGLDGSVALIKIGFDGSVNSLTTNEPVIVFVVGQKGLMGALTFEGYKLTRLKK